MDLNKPRFALLSPSGRVWAIAAIRGDAGRLEILHRQIMDLFKLGDRIIYLGDVLGTGPDIIGAVNEILRFRRWMLSQPPFTHPDDFIVLRGSAEEIWRNLLQIQFAAEPEDVLLWMEGRGDFSKK